MQSDRWCSALGTGRQRFIFRALQTCKWSMICTIWLDSCTSHNSNEKDVKAWIVKATSVLWKWRHGACRNKHISMHVKLRLYEAVILTTPRSTALKYGLWLSPWARNWKQPVIGYSVVEKYPRYYVERQSHKRTKNWGEQVYRYTTLEKVLRESRRGWLGHVVIMEEARIPKQTLYWQVGYFQII